MNELETILYGYVLECNYFGVLKPTASRFNKRWNHSQAHLLNQYMHKQIWAAALNLENKGLIDLDKNISDDVANCRLLTPHEIAERKRNRNS